MAALVDAARELYLFYVPTRHPSRARDGAPAQAFSAARSKRAIEHAAGFVEATGFTLRAS